jgi:hypothetical protein
LDAYAVPKTEYRYRDLSRLTSWLTVLLWAHIGLTILVIVVGVLQAVEPQTAWISRVLSPVGTTEFAIELLLFLVWVYVAAANVHAFGADITFSPGWAVGWFFIPIAALWMAFVVIEEIWRASIDARSWRDRHAGWPAIYWWAGWVVMYLVGLVFSRLSQGPIVLVLLLASQIAYAYFLIQVIARIRDLQQSQAMRTARIASN